MSRIDEIKARLGAASHGEWYYRHEPWAPEIVNGNRSIAKVLYHGGSEDPEVIANADLISNAPSDLAYLISEVERLSEQVDDLLEESCRYGHCETCKLLIEVGPGRQRYTGENCEVYMDADPNCDDNCPDWEWRGAPEPPKEDD